MDDEVTRYDEPRTIDIELPPHHTDQRVVALSRAAVADMAKHACGETQHEIGGYLLGFPAICSRTGAAITWVECAVRAIYDSTPTRVVMKTTSAIELERVRDETGTLLVGWYHSHPGLGIFLSGTDVRNFKDYHPESYQLAIVVDPSRVAAMDAGPTNDWMGVFVWSADGQPARVDSKKLQLLSARPTKVDTRDSK